MTGRPSSCAAVLGPFMGVLTLRVGNYVFEYRRMIVGRGPCPLRGDCPKPCMIQEDCQGMADRRFGKVYTHARAHALWCAVRSGSRDCTCVVNR
jgi:hypothetical protein